MERCFWMFHGVRDLVRLMTERVQDVEIGLVAMSLGCSLRAGCRSARGRTRLSTLAWPMKTQAVLFSEEKFLIEGGPVRRRESRSTRKDA